MTPLVKVLDEQATENEGRDIKNIGLIYFFDEQQAWRDIASALYVEFAGRYGESERADFSRTTLWTIERLLPDLRKTLSRSLLARRERRRT